MDTLRKLIDHLTHIDNGGKLNRELNPVTGRIVSKPVGESIGKLIGAAAGGAGLASGANWLKDKFSSDKSDSDKPDSNKSNFSNAPKNGTVNAPSVGNISDFSNAPKNGTVNAPNSPSSGKNTNSNNRHDGSNISPDDDPEDPKTWPPGVKPAPDFGYLTPDGKWIPTPFNIRTQTGNFSDMPQNHPANLIGIPANEYTPFQKKVQAMKEKHAYVSSSAIEQSKPVNLPGGAPQIPGYKQINASRFNTDAREPGLNKSINWVYAYQNGKNIILIAPSLYYNMKLSTGRYYSTWDNFGIRDGGPGAPKERTSNGPLYVTAQNFPVNDMILSVVVHASVDGIGASILKSLKI